MTEENCRLNVHFEWEKADESLLEIKALMEKDLWAAAISRAYYGIFHLARALLFGFGLEAKSHSGMVHLLSAHLVRNCLFSAEMIRAFSNLQGRGEVSLRALLVHLQITKPMPVRLLLTGAPFRGRGSSCPFRRQVCRASLSRVLSRLSPRRSRRLPRS